MLGSFAGRRSGNGFRASGWGFQAQKGLVHFNGKLLVWDLVWSRQLARRVFYWISVYDIGH